jgi:hypothetical protein
MKKDKTIEKWFKERNDKELSILRTFIKDEQNKKLLLFVAFRWAVKESDELSALKDKYPLSGTNTDDIITSSDKNSSTQIDSILNYRQSGICVRCKKPFWGIIKELNKSHSVDVPLADYLFVSVHEFSGLCTDCIGEFLLDFVNKANSDK